MGCHVLGSRVGGYHGWSQQGGKGHRAASGQQHAVHRDAPRLQALRNLHDQDEWIAGVYASPEYIAAHGIITDPDTSINDPDALVEVSLDGKGTHRLPQDCLRPLD